MGGMVVCAEPPAAHLHVVARDSDFWRRHIMFRDHLRAHPVAATEYGALKQRIAEATGGDRLAYTASKASFIASVLTQVEQATRASS